MSIPDDQIDLLKAAVGILRDLQVTATGANTQVQQVVIGFPPDVEKNLIQFTWRDGQFQIATVT